MPAWIKWIFFDLIAPILKVKRPNSTEEEEMEQIDDKTKEEGRLTQNVKNILVLLLRNNFYFILYNLFQLE